MCSIICKVASRNATRAEKRDYWRRWYQANKPRHIDQNRAYYLKNRESIRRQQAAYRARTRERQNEISREYAASHRAEARARAKAWYDARKDDPCSVRRSANERVTHTRETRSGAITRAVGSVNTRKCTPDMSAQVNGAGGRRKTAARALPQRSGANWSKPTEAGAPTAESRTR